MVHIGNALGCCDIFGVANKLYAEVSHYKCKVGLRLTRDGELMIVALFSYGLFGVCAETIGVAPLDLAPSIIHPTYLANERQYKTRMYNSLGFYHLRWPCIDGFNRSVRKCHGLRSGSFSDHAGTVARVGRTPVVVAKFNYDV
jgi:hypothetical protein